MKRKFSKLILSKGQMSKVVGGGNHLVDDLGTPKPKKSSCGDGS